MIASCGLRAGAGLLQFPAPVQAVNKALWIAGRRRFITMPPLQLTDNFAVVGE